LADQLSALLAPDLGEINSYERSFAREEFGILIATGMVHRIRKEVCHGGNHDCEGVGKIPQNEGGNDLSLCAGGEASGNKDQRTVAIRQKQNRPDDRSEPFPAHLIPAILRLIPVPFCREQGDSRHIEVFGNFPFLELYRVAA